MNLESATEMIVYVKRGCPWCTEALEYLERNEFEYEVRDVLADPESFARMREISGQSLAPTLEVGGKVLADFDTGQLEEFLEANGIQP